MIRRERARISRRAVAVGALNFVLAASLVFGCLGQVERTYVDDWLDGSSDGTAMTHRDGSSGMDAAGADGPAVTDDGGSVDAPDLDADGGAEAADADAQTTTDAGDAVADDASIDAGAGVDAAPESGCGPTNTVANCGACGTSCDTAHSTPLACVSGGSCSYSACSPGWGDCAKAAPNTNGCETPLNTTTNCSACAVTCDTTTSVGAGCNGTTCTYASCKPGWSMCRNTPPNAAGCECNTPGCCDGGCESLHTNGIINTPKPFYDCVPPKTYNSQQAFKACAAFTGSQSTCSGGWMCNGVLQNVVCDNACTTCWVYADAGAGQVTDCTCPGTMSGTWN